MMYFQAMRLGSHAIGLDHGDEDGDVAQRTTLTARYTDTQSVGGTLRKRDKVTAEGALKIKLLSTIYRGKQSYPCDLHCPNARLYPWRDKISDTNFRKTTLQEIEML